MKSFTITPNDAGQRLDKFLRKLLPNAVMGFIFKAIRTGKLKINRKKKEADYRLIEGDVVELHISDEEFTSLSAKSASIPKNKPASKLNPATIIAEDSALIIINKDPFVLVHPGDFKSDQISLIEQVQDYLGASYNALTFKPSLIHRIDRETSGIVMIAKTKEALERMNEAIRNHKVEKTYLAITLGKPSVTQGTITKKLFRKEQAHDENKVIIDEKNGMEAITHYRTLSSDIHGKYALLECAIETGRMHQIRVHLASIGTPILGDDTYGDKRENDFARRNYGIDRHMLHAARVSFIHPKKGTSVTFEAPLKEDMK
jgi:RluA family pseudouridine synthase